MMGQDEEKKEKEKEEKEEEKKEEEKNFLRTGRDGTGRDQSKEVQDVLAGLKTCSDKTPRKTRTVFEPHPLRTMCTEKRALL